ncbi:hypothetical protein BFW88_04565 [Pseudomonas fluorescens]|nr:hypothetical protein BFW88_04565 [Pseudomonas fluorescens]OPB13989.1 hypothetical protein BFW92_04540 [Pseudomonas fluorescens]OPB27619.1 hypothetical protein BFW93_04560 [Pseudomonas fluorescens]
MQQFHVLTAAALLLAGVSTVFAASSVDLSVVGMITPSACTPQLSNGGVVDHGKISFQDLDPRRHTQLPDATLTLTVNCEATALIAVKATDNRYGTAMPEWQGGPPVSSFFGLGVASGGEKIGRYMLRTSNTTADGVARAMVESVDGQTWFETWDALWQPNWLRAANGGSTQQPVPLAVQILRADLLISTFITQKDNLPGTEDIPIDGSATLDIVYL